MPNKDNVEIEKILPALAAIGGAVGRAAMGGGRALAADKLKDKIGQTAGTAMEIADPSNEQDAHAQTEWENIHRSKSMQKLMNFVLKANEEAEYAALDEFGYNKPEVQPPFRRRAEPGTTGLSRPMPMTTGRIRGETEKPEFVRGETGRMQPTRAERNRALVTPHVSTDSTARASGGYTKPGLDPWPNPVYSSRELSAEERAEALGIDTSRPFPREMTRVGTDDELAALYDEEAPKPTDASFSDFPHSSYGRATRGRPAKILSPEEKEARRVALNEYSKKYSQKYRDTRSPEQHEADKARARERNTSPEYRARRNARNRAITVKQREEREAQGLPPITRGKKSIYTPEERKLRQQEYYRNRIRTPEEKAAAAKRREQVRAARALGMPVPLKRRGRPSKEKEGSIQKLMDFLQIQKLGYQEEDRRKRPRKNLRGGGWDTRQPQDLGSQSAGLPATGSKEWEKLKDIYDKTTEPKDRFRFPLEYAHNYLENLQQGETSTAEDTILQHVSGHQAIADVHNMMQFGEDWQTHPDRLEYMHPNKYEDIIRTRFEGDNGWLNVGPSLQRPSKEFMDSIRKQGGQWYARVPLATFQREVIPAIIEPWKGKHGMGISNQAKGMMDDLHRRIRMESPEYDPNDMTIPRLQNPRSARGEPVSDSGSRREVEELQSEEMYGSSRNTYGTETTPLPGRGTPSDEEYQTVERHDRGSAHPFEDYPWTETEEGGVVPRGINQGQMPRSDFDDIYGNPTRYGYGESEGAETLPNELRVNYPSAEERLAAHGGGEENPLEGTVPPPIPGDPPPSPLGNAFEQWRPDLFRDKEKAVAKLQKFLRKEGAVGGEGGGFDGLSDTVFTSTNAGIFTPTYGGKGTKKKHRKTRKRQDKKRQKLMGKEKKSGVERLVQYLYDGSPHISKAGKMGLAPGLDDDMTGNAPTAHAGRNNPTGLQRVNHKKTGRGLKDAMKVAEDNEPHINMGLAGGMEASIAAAYPQEEDPSIMNASNPRKAEWNDNNAYVQKAVNEATTFISPDGGNEAADGEHPQKAFIERTKNNPNEPPAKDAVVKENDMQRRVKKYDNKEEDTGHEQPAGVMAAAGMGGYPSGATMQMSSFGMNTYEQDSLIRGGEEDNSHDEEDIDEGERREDEEGNVWVPMNPDRTKSLESMRKALEDAGDEAPLLTALYKLDYS